MRNAKNGANNDKNKKNNKKKISVQSCYVGVELYCFFICQVEWG